MKAATAAAIPILLTFTVVAHVLDGQGTLGGQLSRHPSGLGGASGGNTTIIEDRKKARKRRGGRHGYDDLIVLCASYCDNAHPRPPKLNGTRAGPPGWQGRNSDGPVWDEFLANLTGPPGYVSTLVNYAYGGAEINNSITPAGVPDIVQQANAFLHDLSIGSPDAGHAKGKALVATWVGINPVRDIWTKLLSTLQANATIAEAENATTAAQEAIAGSTSTLARVMLNISHSHAYRISRPDFLILPIPPAELLLVNQGIANGNPLRLAIAQLLNDSFNAQLRDKVKWLRRNIHRDQRVFTFDVPKWWKSVYFNPTAHNLTVTRTPCVVDGALPEGGCSQHFYYDSLHPTAAVNLQFAQAVAAVIKGHAGEDWDGD